MSLTFEIQDSVAHIQMDDGKANALGFDMIAALNEALDQGEAEAKAIIISGRPGRFSGGFDLSVMQHQPDKVGSLLNAGGHLLLRLFTSPRPVIAACSGHALAAGGLMLLSADTRIGIKGDFKIGLNETAIGMVLPIFGIELPAARLSPLHFTPAVIQGNLYDPESAMEAGFLDKAVAPDDLIQTAFEAAGLLSGLPQHAYHGNKLLIRKPAIDAIKASLVPL
ncbi:MAG: crotonase/enoyl-CoA hydratase family protein [Pseudomonadota bacterium]